MKGGYFASQTPNKSDQELADPLGKQYPYYKINVVLVSECSN